MSRAHRWLIWPQAPLLQSECSLALAQSMFSRNTLVLSSPSLTDTWEHHGCLFCVKSWPEIRQSWISDIQVSCLAKCDRKRVQGDVGTRKRVGQEREGWACFIGRPCSCWSWRMSSRPRLEVRRVTQSIGGKDVGNRVGRGQSAPQEQGRTQRTW